jgi:putative Mn2+ efflux pump MntP
VNPRIAETALIGLALSMDTMAVAAAAGATERKFHTRSALRMALYFGGFQALMPLLGWALGRNFVGYIAAYASIAACALLVFVGAKMLWESRRMEPEHEPKTAPQSAHELVLLAVATSLDALAVGLSFSLLGVSILLPALCIGLITFSLSLGAYYAGSKVGHLFEGRAEALGGIILLALGIKILFKG